jgi:tetratricopeptide (TPR) repeat protein
MRVRLQLVFLLGFLAPLALPADVIVFKSGRRVQAFRVEERGDRIYYETEDGQVGIPKHLVERIERGDSYSAATSASAGAVAEAPPPVEAPELNEPEVQSVIQDDSINQELLASLDRAAEQDGSEAARHRAVAARVVAARFLARRNQWDAAGETLRRALAFAPKDSLLLLELAGVAYVQQRYPAALDFLRPVLDDPAYAFEAHRLQGRIYYLREELDRALEAWKRALTFQYDAELAAHVEQVEREAALARGLADRASGRFILRYEGGQESGSRLAASILAALDAMLDPIASDFDVLPREPIIVILYPDETFYELTGMPPWVHGLFDGKIRVPVRGLASLTPRLEQTLRHELVHALLYLKTRNRAPRWLHEGLAQYIAGQQLLVSAREFVPLFEARDGRGLRLIESFFEGEQEQLLAAYQGSLVVVETLERRYGRGDLERFLDALARGDGVEPALRSAFRLTYEDLDRAVYDAIR